MNEIINRVAISPIVTIDLEQLFRTEPRVVFDLKNFLYQDLILKEKAFRNELKAVNWEMYKGKLVSIYCSTDVIVPNWAFILVGTYLGKYGVEYVIGSLDSLEQYLFESALSKLNPMDYKEKPVVIKGCSKFPVPLYAYGRVMSLIQMHAKSIMYGEPCSAVPLFKADK